MSVILFLLFVMYISGTKFGEHRSDVSRDFLIQYLTVLMEQFMTSSLSSFA